LASTDASSRETEEITMRSLSQLARQTGQVLSAQARRMRANLEDLARQVREAVARTVSQSIAEATHEALQLALEGPPDGSDTWSPRYEEPRRSWDETSSSPRRWPSQSSYAGYGPSEAEYDWSDEHDRSESAQANESAANPQPRRWSRAVTVGCQAAAWWPRRHQGRFSGVVATGIGFAAGVVALLASPVLANAGTAAATALRVLALADAARSAGVLASTWL
jgi:hypothetical protein